MTGNGWSEAILLELDRIDFTPAKSMRAQQSKEVIEQYAKDIDDLPPIKVIAGPDDKHWGVDGFKRGEAFKLKGRTMIPATIKWGTKDDAWWEAVDSNRQHGVFLTNADKRKMVEGTLKRYPQMSALEVAERCGVGDQLVRQVSFVNHEIGPAPIPSAPPADVFPATEDDYVVRRDGKRYPRRRFQEIDGRKYKLERDGNWHRFVEEEEAPESEPEPEPEPEPAEDVEDEVESEGDVADETPEAEPQPSSNGTATTNGRTEHQEAESKATPSETMTTQDGAVVFDPFTVIARVERMLLEAVESSPKDYRPMLVGHLSGLAKTLAKKYPPNRVELTA